MGMIKYCMIFTLSLVFSFSCCRAQYANKYNAPDILAQITDHYCQLYKYGIIKKQTSDSLVTLSFNYDEPYDSLVASTFLVVYIPRWKRDYLVADINSDGTVDVLGSIMYESGVIGPVKGNDIFLFTAVNDTFRKVFVSNSSKLSGCDAGHFYPEKISGKLIKGRSVCWDENDAHCCPGLRYETTVKFDNNKLLFVEKKLIVRR